MAQSSRDRPLSEFFLICEWDMADTLMHIGGYSLINIVRCQQHPLLALNGPGTAHWQL
jgi:hypothetical protein